VRRRAAVHGHHEVAQHAGDEPLTLKSLRGHVVLVDFWTYSCINCQRTLPHVEAWYKRYHKRRFDVIGVQSPEFAFEHVIGNITAAVKSLGVSTRSPSTTTWRRGPPTATTTGRANTSLTLRG